MVMKNLTLILALGLTFAAASNNLFAAQEPSGTLNITVLDENGAVVPDAPVYIYGEHKTRFVGGKEIPGTATFALVPGDYKISTALIKKTGEYLDRYASHEAHVRVIEGDNTVVTLTLKPIDDPMSSISTAELHQIGVPQNIARNLF